MKLILTELSILTGAINFINLTTNFNRRSLIVSRTCDPYSFFSWKLLVSQSWKPTAIIKKKTFTLRIFTKHAPTFNLNIYNNWRQSNYYYTDYLLNSLIISNIYPIQSLQNLSLKPLKERQRYFLKEKKVSQSKENNQIQVENIKRDIPY